MFSKKDVLRIDIIMKISLLTIYLEVVKKTTNNKDAVRVHTTFITANPTAAACFDCTKQPSSCRPQL